MKQNFPNKELEAENALLIEKYLSIETNVDIDDFIEENATDEFKKFLAEEEREKREMARQGIMV